MKEKELGEVEDRGDDRDREERREREDKELTSSRLIRCDIKLNVANAVSYSSDPTVNRRFRCFSQRMGWKGDEERSKNERKKKLENKEKRNNKMDIFVDKLVKLLNTQLQPS